MSQEEARKPKPRTRGQRSRRKPETGLHSGKYNPGQVVLLMDLLREFSGHVEVDLQGSAGQLTIKVESDLPYLETFIGYKIRDLVSQQRRLAQLWKASEAG